MKVIIALILITITTSFARMKTFHCKKGYTVHVFSKNGKYSTIVNPPEVNWFTSINCNEIDRLKTEDDKLCFFNEELHLAITPSEDFETATTAKIKYLSSFFDRYVEIPCSLDQN